MAKATKGNQFVVGPGPACVSFAPAVTDAHLFGEGRCPR
jgi:hypothetical protein